jgi:hypothetical protein
MSFCFIITQVLSSFLNSENCASLYQTVRCGGKRMTIKILRILNIKFLCAGMKCLSLRCTFADPPQMEYMCSSVDCVCFPLWNGLGRTSPVLGSTLGHSGERIPGYKPRYRLEVLLFLFQWGRQFVVAATLPFQKRKYRVLPECLCKSETDSRDVKYKGKSDWSFGTCEITDLCYNSGCLCATSSLVFCKWLLFGCTEKFAFSTGRFNLGKHPGYPLIICFHCVINLFIIIICNSKWTVLRIVQRT